MSPEAQRHLVLFDIDGTLVDSDAFDGRLYVDAVRTVTGLEIGDDWTRYPNVTDSGVLEFVIDEAGLAAERVSIHARVKETFIGLVADYLHARDGALPEIPGARAFVERLAARSGAAVGFATGGWGETAAMKLRAIGLEPGDYRIASASDAIDRVEIIRHAERRVLGDASAARRTYFGDGPWDRRSSAAAGYEFVAIGQAVEHPTAFPDFGDPDAILIEIGLGT